MLKLHITRIDEILYPKLKGAIDLVRDHHKPFVQIVNTYRLNAHSKGDDDRSKSEVKKWWEKEPLHYIESEISKNDLNVIKNMVDEKIEKIVERVKLTGFGSIR